MADFFIKRVSLPSGLEVEIVYYDNVGYVPPDLSPAYDPTVLHLEICPECNSDHVYPVTWATVDDDCWEISLRCPNCEWGERGIYRHEDVEAFDHILNVHTDQVIDDLELMTKANMEDELKAFAHALEMDAILPEDF